MALIQVYPCYDRVLPPWGVIRLALQRAPDRRAVVPCAGARHGGAPSATVSGRCLHTAAVSWQEDAQEAATWMAWSPLRMPCMRS